MNPTTAAEADWGAGVAEAPDPADESLMLAYAAGDAAAFEPLYRRHKDALYRYFLRHVDAADASELFQDVWRNLVNARARYRPDAPFRAWLFALAHNRLMDHFRRSRPGAELNDMMPADATLQPEAIAQRQQTVGRVLSALNALPLEQREIIVLREERELTLEQIAQIQGVGRETVKSRLRYALAKLREVLDE
ncbi:sigma-70 family RNA polymerase sigma factor [Sinimarinibacterium sp. CAU 1509]|uniref:sigma-70 family RNA polymerase sigma factor n=1 Tax=Sinimarinibacterium sp. CAU 1509 TaxID=2562283 RepID=UPI001B7FC077|nr:sigma-70 family RNA polymerase sigma factor [Sinimarinibacterium sp. CAU 1509]